MSDFAWWATLAAHLFSTGVFVGVVLFCESGLRANLRLRNLEGETERLKQCRLGWYLLMSVCLLLAAYHVVRLALFTSPF